ncbi:uncharacterized protein Tco025E_01333 [Trypanosoma conorhini]|uniref:Uncharacterized protein n=1 Tax=Trypanosoma conorhini TaxID=83891 RepID=A0A422Q8R7_9TRYP|nr:uncharacterized protein Tco025E_01333 [Trypanosoma conorhini]RNF26373.1 hypothetical protein Tco025E_01333 [Trypanosoma conorhini]
MQRSVSGDVVSDLSTASPEAALRRRPLFTLGWETVLAEEGAAQTAATLLHDDDGGMPAVGGEADSGEQAALNGRAAAAAQAATVEEVQRRAAWGVLRRVDAPAAGNVFAPTAEAAVRAEVRWWTPPVTPHRPTPAASPPAWTRPSFVGDGPPPQPSARAGGVIQLQEVFPAIGGRRRRRVGGAGASGGDTADRWLREPQEVGAVGPGAWELERFLPGGPGQGSARVVDDVQAAITTAERGEETSPASEEERSTFSWQELMQAVGRRDIEEAVMGGRRREEALQAREASEPRQLHWPQEEPRYSGEGPVLLQREKIAADAEAVGEMQRRARELAHRVLMAERALAEERAECAALREDLARCLEAVELPLQANMNALRELRSENRRLSRWLGL